MSRHRELGRLLGDRIPGEQAVLARVLVCLWRAGPCAPPCMRQRFLPCAAGERHAPPERVLAPQRGLASIGPVFLMFAHACAFRLAAAAPCPRSEPKAEWSLCAASS